MNPTIDANRGKNRSLFSKETGVERSFPLNMKSQDEPSGIRFMKMLLNSMVLVGALTGSGYGNWDAAPLDVHEWGVNTFDWDTGKPLEQEIPDHLYTDKRPGSLFPSRGVRVRDLPPDSGVRTKPILYFYPGKPAGRGTSNAQAKVGVEMRFAFGYANAWWPQVNQYRTEEQSQKAVGPDWESWKKAALEARKKRFLNNNKDGKAVERWEKELGEYRKLNFEDQVRRLVQGRAWERGPVKFPEDKRMQLVWEELTLHLEKPATVDLPGADLPEDHWAKIAREVDAAYVSNGKETERYVFYEGKTSEEPAIALTPAEGGARFSHFGRRPGTAKEVSLVNVGKHPIYDVIAIYRDRGKGILWCGYLPVMQSREVALRIPDFDNPLKSDNLKLSPEEFRRKTSERMIENLTAGTPVVIDNVMGRDPADAQGPTQRHQLYRKEAVGLEKIWHNDFFEGEGFTVIYRESPAYLDEAMPLNVFTSSYWYVRLSRCGLVLNRNIPLEEVYQTDQALYDFQLAEWNDHLKENLKTAVPQLKKNRLLALGQAKFFLPLKHEGNKAQLEKIRNLFE